MTPDKQLTRAVLRVGDGRGFAVAHRNYLGGEERVIITAAHCLELAILANGREGLPPCHPARYLEEETYRGLLAPLGKKPTVWATCLFIDPIADIAVLGQPDNQALCDEAAAYDELIDNLATLVVADAPAQGTELLTFGDLQVKNPTPGESPARVLSLKGRWLEGQVTRRSGRLAFDPHQHFVGGMSGSPIIDPTGAAIGVVSVDVSSPVIVDNLSARLVRAIRAAQPRG
jgi:trypsin-like peptidase